MTGPVASSPFVGTAPSQEASSQPSVRHRPHSGVDKGLTEHGARSVYHKTGQDSSPGLR